MEQGNYTELEVFAVPIKLILSTARFLRYRKLIGRVIGTRGSIVKFQPTEDLQATMFLKRVLDSPEKLDQVRFISCHYITKIMPYFIFRQRESESFVISPLA
jgi:hypothetical protein